MNEELAEDNLVFPRENYYLIQQTNRVNFQTVLDVGLGNGAASLYFARQKKQVTALGLAIDTYGVNFEEAGGLNVKIVEEYFENFKTDNKFDAIWMSHVLEHTQNVGFFLEKAKNLLNEEGWLFITVPPFKYNVVGGHITTGWSLGQLMYNLLISGFNIKSGHFIKYRYNLCAFVQVSKEELPELRRDNGDIELTSHLWPMDVYQGFNGDIDKVNWFE